MPEAENIAGEREDEADHHAAEDPSSLRRLSCLRRELVKELLADAVHRVERSPCQIGLFKLVNAIRFWAAVDHV